MLKEKALGPTSFGGDEGESRSLCLDRQVDELGEGSIIPVREKRVTVRKVNSETIDGEL